MSRRRVVIYSAAFSPRSQADAARGGAHGEIRMASSLAFGLRRLGMGVTAIGRLRRFAAHRIAQSLFSTARFREPPLYIVDPWTLVAAARHGLLKSRDVPRLRILEWYGTPRTRVSSALPGIDASRYLAPYSDGRGWNTFLGFLLIDEADAPLEDAAALVRHVQHGLSDKKPQGVVWGKETRYFSSAALAVIERVVDLCPLHTTLSTARGFRPGLLPRGVINHGVLPPQRWRALLRESTFVLGLGDPVAGPTALDALAEGCVYFDPRYPTPRAINAVGELTIRSQHPYAAAIGEPFVRAIDLADTDATVRAIADSLDPRTRDRLAAASAPDSRLIAALTPFTLRPYLARLEGIV